MPKIKRIPSSIRRKRLVSRADALAALWAKIRTKRETGGMCPFCNKRPIQHCFHFITRSRFSVRWDADNLIGSCAGCNLRNEYEPHLFVTYFINRWGVDKWDALVMKSKQIAKYSLEDLEKICDIYVGGENK